MLPFALAVPATQSFLTGLAGATVATTPFIPVTDNLGNKVPLYALLVLKPNGGSLTQQMLDYSNILQKVGISTLMSALKEWERVGNIVFHDTITDTDLGIKVNPINNNNYDPKKTTLTDALKYLLPSAFVVAPLPTNETGVSELPEYVPMPDIVINPLPTPESPTEPIPETPIEPTPESPTEPTPETPIEPTPELPTEPTPEPSPETPTDPIVVAPYIVPQFPIYQGVLCELISGILTELRQFVITEAQNMASKMDEYLQRYNLAVNYCSSNTQTEYGFERCMDDIGEPYRIAYNDIYYKSVALNQAYISLSADLVRSLLRQCLKPDMIWTCLGGISQDMFTSKEDFMESAQWEREQMASQEPCCLKRLCCYDYRG
ncbi:MAG: hypothetical protein RBR07_04815 [Arcobacteraceae bacterium]|jgi:hypothetical protein|nr:hypothetical protein [Arcobacteraceae bacterium]